MTAKQVLVATGPSRKGPFFYFRRRIVPVGSFIIATAPLSPAQVDSVMPTRRNATTSKNIGNYFRLTLDNRLIFGGRARFALSSPTSDLKSGRILEADAEGDVSAARRRAHRVLLGRPGRPDGRPPSPRRRA